MLYVPHAHLNFPIFSDAYTLREYLVFKSWTKQGFKGFCEAKSKSKFATCFLLNLSKVDRFHPYIMKEEFHSTSHNFQLVQYG